MHSRARAMHRSGRHLVVRSGGIRRDTRFRPLITPARAALIVLSLLPSMYRVSAELAVALSEIPFVNNETTEGMS